MKKLSWIIAMFAVLGLLFVGCPEDPDDGKKESAPDLNKLTLGEVFPDTEVTQDKATVSLGTDGKSVTFSVSGVELWGELVKDSYVNASAYSGISFEYKTTGDDVTVYFVIPDGKDGAVFALWGAFTQNDWTEAEYSFSEFEHGWGENIKFNKSKIYKLMAGSDSTTSMERKLEIRNFKWVK
ncbi:MAG: hypothetical protein LBU66_02290 [Treponema sp.]|nr:hypothetical protein [Treponema sp.]